jgi:Family of unknown function (DUF6141)
MRPMAAVSPEQVRFSEVQRFSSHRVLAPLVLIACVGAWVAVVLAIASGGPGKPPVWEIALILVVATLVPLMLATLRQVTEVTASGVRVRLAPLQPHGREVCWPQLVRYAAISYRPLREYGGWGIRGGGDRMAYNASGDLGVLVETSDGRSLLIGSLRPLELERAIARASGRTPPPRSTPYATADKGRLVP